MSSPKTTRELATHLPDVLARLAVQYMCTDPRDAAKCGAYEMCEQGTNDGVVFETACKAGHLALVKSMIARCVEHGWGIVDACAFGHLHILHFLIAIEQIVFMPTLCRAGLHAACKNGHLAVVKRLISARTSWERCLTIACSYNQPHIARFMLERGATSCGHCHKLEH